MGVEDRTKIIVYVSEKKEWWSFIVKIKSMIRFSRNQIKATYYGQYMASVC